MTTTAANRFKCDNCGHSQSFNDGFQCSACGQGTIVPSMTDAPPSSPVDLAAVEAAERIWKQTATGTMSIEWVTTISYIITDANADQKSAWLRSLRKESDYLQAASERLDIVEDCLTAERAVREKLVRALKEYCSCSCCGDDYGHTWCDRCRAIAAAEKLEKQDAG